MSHRDHNVAQQTATYDSTEALASQLGELVVAMPEMHFVDSTPVGARMEVRTKLRRSELLLAAEDLPHHCGSAASTTSNRPDTLSIMSVASESDRTAVPLQRLTTARAVADQLRESIQRGMIRPGTRLRQAQIAKEFGVSTTPVREAFALLRSEGFVDIDPHRGATVFTATIADITEAYEIRTTLELLAATKALPNLDDETVNQMQRLTDQMRKTTDSAGYLELNRHFHDTLYQAASRPRLRSIIEGLHVSVAGYLNLYLSHLSGKARSEHFDNVNSEHQEILDACRARDARALSRALQSHRDRTVQAIVEMLETTPVDERSRLKPW